MVFLFSEKECLVVGKDENIVVVFLSCGDSLCCVYLERGHFLLTSRPCVFGQNLTTKTPTFLACRVCLWLLMCFFSKSSRIVSHKKKYTAKSFIRDTVGEATKGGGRRRRCETTRKEEDEETNRGGSSRFFVFFVCAVVSPHLRFFLRFSFSSFFLPRLFSIFFSRFWRWFPHPSFLRRTSS